MLTSGEVEVAAHAAAVRYRESGDDADIEQGARSVGVDPLVFYRQMKPFMRSARRAEDAMRRTWLGDLGSVALGQPVDVRPADVEDALVAFGIGPDGRHLAVWARPGSLLVTGDDRSPLRWEDPGVESLTGAPSFVQPMPDGQVLLVRSRSRAGETNAEVRDESGRLVEEQAVGDAVEEVLTTPSGHVWVGHFDENPLGLRRWSPGLEQLWSLNDHVRGRLRAYDIYSLNVQGETALACPYTDFHVMSSDGVGLVDHGRAPVRGAHGLLTDGARGALIGGYGSEGDVVTPVRVAPHVVQEGRGARLVLPDGSALPPSRLVCRGFELQVRIGTLWYRADLDRLTAHLDA